MKGWECWKQSWTCQTPKWEQNSLSIAQIVQSSPDPCTWSLLWELNLSPLSFFSWRGYRDTQLLNSKQFIVWHHQHALFQCNDLTHALQKLGHDRRSFFLNFVLAVIGRGLGNPSAKEKNECFNQKGLHSKEWQLFIPGLNW